MVQPEMTTCRVAWTEDHTPILLLLVPRAEGEASGVSVSVFELKLQKMNTIPSHSHHTSLRLSLSSRFLSHCFSFGFLTKINHLAQFKICASSHFFFLLCYFFILFFRSVFGILSITS